MYLTLLKHLNLEIEIDMVKIISFDVGIKNLAYCVISFDNPDNIHDHVIEDWGVIDIMEKFLDEAVKCSVNKKGVLCSSPAISAVNIDTKLIGFCNKKTCQGIAQSNYSKKQIKKLKVVNTKSVSQLNMTSEMINKLRLLPNLLDVDIVVIENQPVLKNPTMKSIQMVLYSFFLINGYTSPSSSITNIALFNASRKLDIYDGPEITDIPDASTYSGRKKLSIAYTQYFLKNNSTKLEFFNKHKKKDDLADSYLQCLTYYKKKV
jgi:hypothetical protein|tara:strand:+ start:3254 stop:4042 length:789 start_codon:yes stop_codon:yes gene_type:complete